MAFLKYSVCSGTFYKSYTKLDLKTVNTDELKCKYLLKSVELDYGIFSTPLAFLLRKISVDLMGDTLNKYANIFDRVFYSFLLNKNVI